MASQELSTRPFILSKMSANAKMSFSMMLMKKLCFKDALLEQALLLYKEKMTMKKLSRRG
jgi:hypothetical protein